MTQAPPSRKVSRWDLAAILLLGAAGCALSYDALQQMAVAIHVRGPLTYAFPLVIDGFIAYGVRALVLLRNAAFSARLYAWTLFGGATAASIWANALHAVRLNEQTTGSRHGLQLGDNTVGVLSTLAPLALGGAVHLYILISRHAHERPDQNTADQSVQLTRESDRVSLTKPDRSTPADRAVRTGPRRTALAAKATRSGPDNDLPGPDRSTTLDRAVHDAPVLTAESWTGPDDDAPVPDRSSAGPDDDHPDRSSGESAPMGALAKVSAVLTSDAGGHGPGPDRSGHIGGSAASSASRSGTASPPVHRQASDSAHSSGPTVQGPVRSGGQKPDRTSTDADRTNGVDQSTASRTEDPSGPTVQGPVRSGGQSPDRSSADADRTGDGADRTAGSRTERRNGPTVHGPDQNREQDPDGSRTDADRTNKTDRTAISEEMKEFLRIGREAAATAGRINRTVVGASIRDKGHTVSNADLGAILQILRSGDQNVARR